MPLASSLPRTSSVPGNELAETRRPRTTGSRVIEEPTWPGEAWIWSQTSLAMPNPTRTPTIAHGLAEMLAMPSVAIWVEKHHFTRRRRCGTSLRCLQDLSLAKMHTTQKSTTRMSCAPLGTFKATLPLTRDQSVERVAQRLRKKCSQSVWAFWCAHVAVICTPAANAIRQRRLSKRAMSADWLKEFLEATWR